MCRHPNCNMFQVWPRATACDDEIVTDNLSSITFSSFSKNTKPVTIPILDVFACALRNSLKYWRSDLICHEEFDCIIVTNEVSCYWKCTLVQIDLVRKSILTSCEWLQRKVIDNFRCSLTNLGIYFTSQGSSLVRWTANSCLKLIPLRNIRFDVDAQIWWLFTQH